MKRVLITIAALLMLAIGNGQNVQFGVKAGVNLATLSGDVSDLDSRFSFHLGAVAEIPLSEVFSVQPELLYSGQGFKAGDDVVKLDYINLPIMAKYYVADGFSIEAGPQIGYMLSAKSEIDDEGDVGYEYQLFDFGVNIGLGYKPNSELNLGIRYNWGLASIVNWFDEFFNDEKISNSVLQISIGYNF